MKRWALLVVWLFFLIVFFVDFVSAEITPIQDCVYIDNINIDDENCVTAHITENSSSGIFRIDDFQTCWNFPPEQDILISGWKPYSIDSYFSSIFIYIKDKQLALQYNSLTRTRYNGGGLDSILEDSRTDFPIFIPDDGFFQDHAFSGIMQVSFLNNSNNPIFENVSGYVCLKGYYIDNNGALEPNSFDTRISALESWKNTMTDTLTQIWAAITGHTIKITALENNYSSNITGNFSSPYFKYLGSTDRKNIICGYSKDNHLTNVTDLGWNCITTYKTNSRGVESSSCRCKAV